jgi:hypothetical protein
MKDDLLKQGPREAPEPETAEQRTNRTGMKTAGGGIAAGGIGLAKMGLLGKFFIYLFLWNGIRTTYLLGGWIGIAIIAAAIAAFFLYRRQQQHQS